MTTDHTPWCDHTHPDTDDGTGATPCTSRPVMLWPGAVGWLRSPSYPADMPAVVVSSNRGGSNQTVWALAEFRQMLWAGMELCATANLGTWPAPDPGPAPHTERSQAEIEADADDYARNTISPEFADMLLSRSADAERTAELAAAAIPVVVDDQPSTPDLLQALQDSVDRAKAGRPVVARTADGIDIPATGERMGIKPRQICTCSFLPDPHVWGASCPMTGHL